MTHVLESAALMGERHSEWEPARVLQSGERNSAQDGGRVRRRSAASHGKLKRAA